MHARFALMALLALALPARALTLDDVRRSLAEYHGVSPMSVKIDSVERRVDGKEKSESSGTSMAEDDGAQLRMVHDKKELSRRQQTKKNRADYNVSADEALELMNYAPKLLRTLEGATLKKVSQTALDGAPATLLEIVPVREKDEDGDKWVKGYADTLLVWLGAGGVPLAAERTMKITARIVVIGRECNRKERFRFHRAADRLVVTRWSEESSGSGFGQSQNGTKSATVTVLR
jgi:hypothetical protein